MENIIENNNEEMMMGTTLDTLAIELEDMDGNKYPCNILDMFDYNDITYFIAENPMEDSNFIVKMVGKDLMEPTDDEFKRVVAFYTGLNATTQEYLKSCENSISEE